jgi:PD-(D/E)XK nuclease superfamily
MKAALNYSMPHGATDTYPTSRRVSLRTGTSVEAAWEHVILPWFEAIASKQISKGAGQKSDVRAQRSERRGLIAVVTPYRSHAYFMRSRLLARGISLLGVKFLSPPQLRDLLLRSTALTVPLREHLRLLLAATAEEVSAKLEGASEEGRVAKAVARDPDNFLRGLDQLSAAGWDLNEIDTPIFREIVSCFEGRVAGCGFTFVHQADRAVGDKTEGSPPIFDKLLLSGFDGAHWPLWPLLRAAVKSAAEATVVLNDPRDEARDIDEVWVGTWEETFGAADAIPNGDEKSTSLSESLQLPLTPSEQKARAEQPTDDIHFLLGRNDVEQARAIVALTAKFLADDRCQRIGILFARPGPLARLVASFLESAKIAHDDGIAHLVPSVFDGDAWRTWLDLQADPRLKILVRFLRASGVQLFENLSIFHVEEVLRRAYSDVLLDNLDVLREYCARNADDERATAIARGLGKIEFLPANGTLIEFLSQTRKILTSLGWKEHWREVDRLSRNWSQRCTGSFSKRIYLGWLREVLGAPSLSRDEFGGHLYSRVHLLPYSEAEGQSWSHLILAGLNEETWPALDDDLGFIREQQIHDFNSHNRVLNRRAVKRGRHGEGQWSIAENKTLFLGAAERRSIRRRQLRNVIESVSTAIGVTGNLYSEAFPSRIANPTDFFSWLYFVAHGRGVSQQTLQSLEQQTRAWLKDWSPVDAQKIDSISVGRTRYAFDARRQRRPAGQFEFALSAPPDKPVALRVTDWEQALRCPAVIWMKVFLGIEGSDEDGDAWPAAAGQWVHRWLAESTQTDENEVFVPITEVEEIRGRLLTRARAFREFVQDLCATRHTPLPDWWMSGWSNALYLADCLAAKLSDLSNDWSCWAVEWPLGSPFASVSLGENEILRLRGRIDLILARGERDQSRLGYGNLWLVDYKTGRQRGFNLHELRGRESNADKFRRQLIKGKGVQLALYALAVRALGAEDVQLTVLGTVDDLEPQFRLEDAVAQTDFWRELHRMQQTGVFGMFGSVHSDYGFARPYPLATLPIDTDLLEEKWVLTHPAFAVLTEKAGRM